LESANVTVIHKNGIQSEKTPFVTLVRRAGQPLVISVKEDKCMQATTIEKNATVSGAFLLTPFSVLTVYLCSCGQNVEI
jgi:hypothetical protein